MVPYMATSLPPAAVTSFFDRFSAVGFWIFAHGLQCLRRVICGDTEQHCKLLLGLICGSLVRLRPTHSQFIAAAGTEIRRDDRACRPGQYPAPREAAMAAFAKSWRRAPPLI